MKKLTKLATVSLLLLPFTTNADDWSAEQQEVIDFELGCWNAFSEDDFADCFNDDYAGWVLGQSVVMNKADRIALNAGNTDELTVNLFKPMSIVIKGNVAVVNYVVVYSVTDDTGETANFSERWIDVAAKEDGRWSWISDFGSSIGD